MWGLGVFFLSEGIGFLRAWGMKKEIGNFGGKAFWSPARPLHAALYVAAAFSALAASISGSRWVSFLLLGFMATDTIFGLVFASHHYAFRLKDPEVVGCCCPLRPPQPLLPPYSQTL